MLRIPFISPRPDRRNDVFRVPLDWGKVKIRNGSDMYLRLTVSGFTSSSQLSIQGSFKIPPSSFLLLFFCTTVCCKDEDREIDPESVFVYGLNLP